MASVSLVAIAWALEPKINCASYPPDAGCQSLCRQANRRIAELNAADNWLYKLLGIYEHRLKIVENEHKVLKENCKW